MSKFAIRLAGGALTAAFVAGLAAPAIAASQWTATAERPVASRNFVADSVIWRCSHTSCHTVSDTSVADQLGACAALVHKIGPLRSFSEGGAAYDAKHLASCNAAAGG